MAEGEVRAWTRMAGRESGAVQLSGGGLLRVARQIVLPLRPLPSVQDRSRARARKRVAQAGASSAVACAKSPSRSDKTAAVPGPGGAAIHVHRHGRGIALLVGERHGA